MSDTKPESDRAANELVVTPEMIEAGLEAYRATRPGEASGFKELEVIAEVFRAMAKAQRDHR